jgi:uncharacterized membrane protein YbhN (UPF0104 family)
MQLGWIAAAIALEILSCLGYVLAFLQVFETTPIRFGGRVALTEQAFGAAVSLGGAGSVAVGAWLLIERGEQPTPVAERSAVLFLITSAVNVITLALTGLALFLGILPGPRNPLFERRTRRRRDHRTRVLPCASAPVRAWRLQASARTRPDAAQDDRRERPRHQRPPAQTRLADHWRVRYLWCDIAVLAACFAATGHSPPLAAIVLAYQIGYLSNLIPIPGGIGVLDGSMVGMLVLYGVAATPAAAATIVYHAISLWIPAMWGTGTFLVLRRTRHQPLTLRPPLAERRRLRADRRHRPDRKG